MKARHAKMKSLLICFFLVKKKRLAMLDLLIAASRENSLADLDIREEDDTFMFEVHISINFFKFLYIHHLYNDMMMCV